MPNLLSIFGLSIFIYNNNNNNNNRYCSKEIKVPILGGRAERTARKICPLEMEQNKEFASFSKDEGWCKPKILRLNNMSLRHKNQDRDAQSVECLLNSQEVCSLDASHLH